MTSFNRFPLYSYKVVPETNSNYNRMSSPPRNYDKYTYALKRKPEKEASPPSSAAKLNGAFVDAKTGLLPLSLNRDGFAVAEDGSLMSRVVSPPLSFAPIPVAGYTAPSLAGIAKSPAKAKPSPIDGWLRLVQSAENELSEEEIALLQWETVQGLLTHYGITNPVDVARAQLVWKRKQQSVLDGDFEPESFNESLNNSQRLHTQPMEQITYGRPASPRSGGKRYIPDHKKPLKWKAEPKVDSGVSVLSARSGSRGGTR